MPLVVMVYHFDERWTPEMRKRLPRQLLSLNIGMAVLVFTAVLAAATTR